MEKNKLSNIFINSINNIVAGYYLAAINKKWLENAWKDKNYSINTCIQKINKVTGMYK